MDLGTLVTNVMDATGRPDKEAFIRTSVPSVIKFISAQYDFDSARVESVTPVISAAILNVAVPANLRRMEYIRPLPFNVLVKYVQPSRIIQPELKQELVNVYYISNGQLVIRLRGINTTTQLAMGWFAYPTMPVLDTDTNWVLTDFGDLVFEILCAKVFRITGDKTSAVALEGGEFGITAKLKFLRETGQQYVNSVSSN